MGSVESIASVVRETRGATTYTASVFAFVFATMVVFFLLVEVLSSRQSAWEQSGKFIDIAVTFALTPFVWLLTYLIAFIPVMVVVCTNRVLCAQQRLSDRIRFGVICVFAIGLSTPISALIWRFSYDGYTFLWPIVITVVVGVACRELFWQGRAGKLTKHSDD